MSMDVICVANLLGLEGSAIPENAKDVPLGQKRKQGAPKKATRALLINETILSRRYTSHCIKSWPRYKKYIDTAALKSTFLNFLKKVQLSNL